MCFQDEALRCSLLLLVAYRHGGMASTGQFYQTDINVASLVACNEMNCSGCVKHKVIS